MKHTEFLDQARALLTERGKDYGELRSNFKRIATIASALLGRTVTEYEVAAIHIATKMGRAAESPGKEDTWADLINYAAFAGEFATEPGAITTAPTIFGPQPVRSEDAFPRTYGVAAAKDAS